MNPLNDHTRHALAVDWYHLNKQARIQELMPPDDLFNDLIESGLLLKEFLRQGKFTKLRPMNVVFENNSSFNIWLTEDDQIQTSRLSDDAD